MYLAIDPGRSTGWALVSAHGELVACGHGEKFPPCVSAIIERPQVYRHDPVDPNNLITLAIRVGRYQERLEARGVRVGVVLPATWKGQIKKNVHHPRVFKALSGAERAVLRAVLATVTTKQAEDVFDAVALAKESWESKRYS